MAQAVLTGKLVKAGLEDPTAQELVAVFMAAAENLTQQPEAAQFVSSGPVTPVASHQPARVIYEPLHRN
jgi:hypothetical protein